MVPPDVISRIMTDAFAEDLGDVGDVTSQMLIERDRRATARLVARSAGVIAGLRAIAVATHPLVRSIRDDASFHIQDGARVDAGTTLATFEAPLRELLAVERTMLNLLGHLSGVATMTRAFVDAIDGTNATICDTRKTTPGLRQLEKYAVRCGGGTSHRMGLHDAMLIKDNHIAHLDRQALAPTLTEAITRARSNASIAFVEVEVDSMEQLAIVLGLENGLVDIVLLDNMSNDALRNGVTMRDDRAPRVRLEASGGVTLNTVRGIAATGVDRISVGAMTHSAPNLDVAIDVT